MRATRDHDSAHGRMLLQQARHAIEQSLGVAGPTDPSVPAEADWLLRPGATFVTLEIDGALRGCVGSITPKRSLGEDVRINAIRAAFEDRRFPPLGSTELPRLRISISLLSALEPLEPSSEEELAALLRPGVDGLLLDYRGRRATFLPQVWSSLPEPETFLAALKEKAGLEPAFWHPELLVHRYEAQSWSER